MSIQFDNEKILLLKKRIEQNKNILLKLKKDTKEIFDHKIIVPKTGIATWNLYYYCPIHSVRLKWDIDKPYEHICPIDGEVFKGEPYDGAWWRWINGLNSKFVYQGALIGILSENEEYLLKVKKILLEYSKYYPLYEEHGGIPNNGPGKANAQTLCESIMLREFAMGYDLIKEKLSIEEQKIIEENLLNEGAKFLVKHRESQLHNHEVKISATIGIIGIILKNEFYINYALEEKWGIKYQIENGLLKDGLWFEGSLRYHIYSLEALFIYEKFAYKTKYSMINHPNYKAMLEVIPKFLLPDNSMPKLNDVIYGQHLINLSSGFENINPASVFEFSYTVFKDKISLWFLNEIYKSQPRDNMEYFLFGTDYEEKIIESPIPEKYFSEENGYSIITHNKEKYLLFKHNIFGGEHDHFDRLGIIYQGYGKEMISDLGTTGYGAKLHYGYYKNTATHNTVNINGDNQPPTKAVVLNHEYNEDQILTDAFVDFDQKFDRIDSHKAIEWNVDSYKNVKMRRIVKSCNDYLLDIFLVENPNLQQIEWVVHVDGELKSVLKNEKNIVLSEKEPYKFLEKTKEISISENLEWVNEEVCLKLWYNENSEIENILAKGPNNPNLKNIDYLIRRSNKKSEKFITAYELSKVENSKINSIKFDLNEEEIIFTISYKNNSIKIEKIKIK